MKSKELRQVLASSGLTVRKAAALLEMQERQLYRYLSGEADIPRVVELALRWIIKEKRS